MKGSMSQKGTTNGRCKLTEAQVEEIRAILHNRMTYKVVAHKYNVSVSTISGIVNNANWTHTIEKGS